MKNVYLHKLVHHAWSLLTYPKAQGHLNDPSVLLHSEFGLFPQVWLPVAHLWISEWYDRMQISVLWQFNVMALGFDMLLKF